MAYYIDKQNITIDSKNRISGTHCNFRVIVDIDHTKKYDSIVLLAASIPKSFYNIQAGYSSFTLREGLTDTTITLTPGNYTRKSLAVVLTATLTANSPNGWTYSYSYNTSSSSFDTGKYTFTVSGNTSQPSFIFTTTMNEVLGFEANTTYTFTGDNLTAPNVCNLSHENTIFVKSDIVRNFNDCILQEIITAGNATFSFIDFKNFAPYEYSKEYNGLRTNEYYFRITDESDIELELNGLNVVLTLMIFRKK